MRIGRPHIVMDGLLWVSTTFAVLVGARLLSLMFAPALVGFIAGWLLDVTTRQADGVNRHASLARRLRQRWSPSVFLGAFSAAFISAWPMIVYWDLLANPEVAHLKVVFFALYLIYMFAFGYVALLGLLAAIFVREQLRADLDSKKVVSAGELTRVGALWLLHSGIASVALDAITK